MQLFLAFVVALSITAALIPLLEKWAPFIGLNDAPGPRKVHALPVPRVGGLAMAAGVLIPTLIALETSRELQGLLVGLSVLLIFGIWDDRSNLGYRTKLVGQVTAVVLCMAVGDIRFELTMPDGAAFLPDFVWAGLTFFVLVGVTNAVNLSDGLDGLAGGLALLCFCALALLGAATDNTIVMSVALIETGAILGFLRFNTHPARVFMGDSGSQMLGFAIAVLAILATQNERSTMSSALPLLLIGVPVLDTLTVMTQRIREGRSPFSSDRNHLHHKLLALGFAHAEAVILIYVIQVVLFLLAYALRYESNVLIVSVFVIFAAVVLLALRQATKSGWHAHASRPSSGAITILRRFVDELPHTRLPSWALVVMGTGFLAYACMVIVTSERVGSDVGLLCLILLPLLLLTARLERAVCYVAVVLIVYLDQTGDSRIMLLPGLSWTLLSITGAAAVIRFVLLSSRKFNVTSLDLLVVFIALVVPNLPGLVHLPEELPAGIAKAVILLYVVEMALAADLKKAVPRALLASMLGAIGLRALFAAVM